MTIAMGTPYSADVSIHLERCINPTISIQPSKPIVSLQCGNMTLVIDCSQGKKPPVASLLSSDSLYLGHVECKKVGK
jgi:hypothetical protein